MNAALVMIDLEIEGGIARLTLMNPPVNALSTELLGALNDALDRLQARDDWQVLVISSYASVFSAGGDLSTLLAWMDGPNPGASVGDYASSVQRLFTRMEQLPQVTVAECAQSALGGGLELALSCDLRIASSRARFGLPEVRLGLLPGAGGTQRLSRLCGKATAMRLIFGAEVIDAERARELGIVQWVFPADKFAGHSLELVRRIASMPKEALRHAKACISLSHAVDGDEGYRREIAGLSALAETRQTRARVADFLAGARDGRLAGAKS